MQAFSGYTFTRKCSLNVIIYLYSNLTQFVYTVILHIFLTFIPCLYRCSGVLLDSDESDNEEEESAQMTGKELLSSSEELNYWPESDEKPEITKSKSSVLFSINHKYVAGKMFISYLVFCISGYKSDFLCFDRVALLGASRCAAPVEPL